MPEPIHAFAARQAGAPLEPFTYTPDDLAPDEVEVDIESCGICHSDVAMIDNDWGMSRYPLVAGHEGVGRVVRKGSGVNRLREGDRVGVGWFSNSCITCRTCLSGDHNMCGDVRMTIVGRHGCFADRVVAQDIWCVPIPEGVDPAAAGPLFCAGITVFNPMVQFDVRPTHKVGVVGIGGLGHLAVKFLAAWGCEVWAFTTSPGKANEAKTLGAHGIINTREEGWDEAHAGQFDFLISTVSVDIEWQRYLNVLSRRGRFHVVGLPDNPMSIPVAPLIFGQREVSATPSGPPSVLADMLDFCARHDIAPQIERFAMADINKAMERMRSGQARYRVVLER